MADYAVTGTMIYRDTHERLEAFVMLRGAV